MQRRTHRDVAIRTAEDDADLRIALLEQHRKRERRHVLVERRCETGNHGARRCDLRSTVIQKARNDFPHALGLCEERAEFGKVFERLIIGFRVRSVRLDAEDPVTECYAPSRFGDRSVIVDGQRLRVACRFPNEHLGEIEIKGARLNVESVSIGGCLQETELDRRIKNRRPRHRYEQRLHRASIHHCTNWVSGGSWSEDCITSSSTVEAGDYLAILLEHSDIDLGAEMFLR